MNDLYTESDEELESERHYNLVMNLVWAVLTLSGLALALTVWNVLLFLKAL